MKLARICLIIFACILLFYFVKAFYTKPFEGDSIAYHIPITKQILDGSVVKPPVTFDQIYFPGASEAILSLFIIFGVPLNLFNVLAIFLLFAGCYFLFLRFSDDRSLAVIFAVAICTVNVVLRWIEAQTVDIWVGVYFVSGLALLTRPLKSAWNYMLLGFFLGMLMGSKYSGILFSGALLLIYHRNFLKNVNFSKVLAFIFPILVFALPWYLRNWFVIGDPFYPISIFPFKGDPGSTFLETPVWKSYLINPKSTFDAFVSEYMLWSLTLFWAVAMVFRRFVKKVKDKGIEISLLILGLLNFFMFLFFTSWDAYQTRVSTLRYSYATLIPLVLAFFLYFQKTKYRVLLGLATILSILTILAPSYHPKILFIIFGGIATLIALGIDLGRSFVKR